LLEATVRLISSSDTAPAAADRFRLCCHFAAVAIFHHGVNQGGEPGGERREVQPIEEFQRAVPVRAEVRGLSVSVADDSGGGPIDADSGSWAANSGMSTGSNQAAIQQFDAPSAG
jgi:hypothetical protein